MESKKIIMVSGAVSNTILCARALVILFSPHRFYSPAVSEKQSSRSSPNSLHRPLSSRLLEPVPISTFIVEEIPRSCTRSSTSPSPKALIPLLKKSRRNMESWTC